MGIGNDALAQLQHLLRPLTIRIANTVARGIVQLVDDSSKMQLVQIGADAGETIAGITGKGGEHFQPYGFSSVPLVGAEAVAVFPKGDREHALIIAVDDRRYRPTGGEPGQVMQYHYKGATVTMLANGNIELTPGPGGQILLNGDADPIARKSDLAAITSAYSGHTHAAGTMAAPSGGGAVTGITAGASSMSTPGCSPTVKTG